MKNCPFCKSKMVFEQYREPRHGVVETYTACPSCKEYVDHYSYGRQTFKIKSEHFEFTPHEYPEEIQLLLYRGVSASIKEAKKNKLAE